MKKGAKLKYTPELIKQEVKRQNFTKRSELKAYNSAMFQSAYRQGLLDSLFGKSGRKTKRKVEKVADKVIATITDSAPRNPRAKRKTTAKVTRKPIMLKRRATVTKSTVDEEKVLFSFDVSLRGLTATEAEKALLVFKNINAA